MTINMTTFTYPVELSVTEQPIKLTISNLMYQASGVTSVNAKTGNVVLTAADVGADAAGAAQLVRNDLQSQIDSKANQTDLDLLDLRVVSNTQKLLNKADIATLTTLAQLVDTKADQSYVVSEIARITGNAPAALDTLAEIAAQLGNDETQINNLLDQIGNRVRFDAAQGLTTAQQTQARDNINAEAKGVAASLVSGVTVVSIGAATSEQGAKADSALQPSDVSTIVGTLLSGLTTVAASAISATDSIIGAFAKLQASVDTKADAVNTLLALGLKQDKLPTTGTAGQFLAHDLTFKTPSGGGGGDTITWVALPRYTGNFETNLTTYDPPMIGKSSDGIIYIKGTFVFSTNPNTNQVFASIIPQTYRPAAMLSLVSNGAYLAFQNNIAIGQANVQPWQIRLIRFDASTTILALASTTTLNADTGATLMIPQTRLGKGV